MKLAFTGALVASLISGALTLPAFADDKPTAAPASEGILPVPDYTGDIFSRSHLGGDWGGTRTELANKGFQFDVESTQILQKNTGGGLNPATGYGVTNDYNMTLDLMRMGVLPGALITFKGQSRFGDSVNGDAGTILPVNTNAFFPLSSPGDEDISFTISDLNYTQFLSENFGVIVGKMDTLDGDPNEFASGRGATQFQNSNFVFNPALALRFPYSTLGAGVIWIPVPATKDGGIFYKSLVFSTQDSSTSSGFGNLGDGGSWINEADFQYRVSDLPGGQNLGFLYSFDQSFKEIGDRFILEPGQGLVKPTNSSTWSLYWSAWQYLAVWDPSDKPINLTNKVADHQGIGLFARAGTANQDNNPVTFAMSAGLGGRGAFCRENDTYGFGYYYTNIQTTRFTDRLGIADDAQGYEAYYSIGLTPAVQLTVDLQTVQSAVPGTDDAFIVGGRLRVVL